MLYVCEVGQLRKNNVQILSVSELIMLRWMSGNELKDRIQNEYICKKLYR